MDKLEYITNVLDANKIKYDDKIKSATRIGFDSDRLNHLFDELKDSLESVCVYVQNKGCKIEHAKLIADITSEMAFLTKKGMKDRELIKAEKEATELIKRASSYKFVAGATSPKTALLKMIEVIERFAKNVVAQTDLYTEHQLSVMNTVMSKLEEMRNVAAEIVDESSKEAYAYKNSIKELLDPVGQDYGDKHITDSSIDVFDKAIAIEREWTRLFKIGKPGKEKEDGEVFSFLASKESEDYINDLKELKKSLELRKAKLEQSVDDSNLKAIEKEIELVLEKQKAFLLEYNKNKKQVYVDAVKKLEGQAKLLQSKADRERTKVTNRQIGGMSRIYADIISNINDVLIYEDNSEVIKFVAKAFDVRQVNSFLAGRLSQEETKKAIMNLRNVNNIISAAEEMTNNTADLTSEYLWNMYTETERADLDPEVTKVSQSDDEEMMKMMEKFGIGGDEGEIEEQNETTEGTEQDQLNLFEN
ncbi:MAG: hypothetical protein MJ239_05265 [Bacilli bacterium]|nr:hypothetical protein [Bacilli bacterium]